MTLEELFRKLSYGELSNLAVAVDSTGTIRKDKQNQVIHFANEALTRLHSRFLLIPSESILTMTGAEVVTPLAPDVIQVWAILTAWGQSLEFGAQPVPGTLYVYDRELHIPARETGSQLQVTYQNRHPTLNPITTDASLAQSITLVNELQEALTAYIASKMYAGILTPEALQAAAMHKARYEQVCLEAQHLGVTPGESLPCQKFEERGWV